MTKQQRRMILLDAESLASGETCWVMQTNDYYWPEWLIDLWMSVFIGPYEINSREHRILCLLLLLEMDGE